MPGAQTTQDALAKAGAAIMDGQSLKQALILAGYSPATARNPEQNNIGAERCLQAAKDAGYSEDSATIASRARRLLNRKMSSLLLDQGQLEATRAGEVARIVDVAEKYHGTAELDKAERLISYAERVERLRLLMDHASPLQAGAIEARGDGE